MGREVRMVPPNWEHSKKWAAGIRGPEERLQPMFDRSYEEAAEEWMKEYADFLADPKQQAEAREAKAPYFWDYHGAPPDKEYYRPYKTAEATWFQLWETVSEGTPVSPPFATKEELAAYLAIHGDDWDRKRGRGGWGIERAQSFVESGWAPSFVVANGRMYDSKDVPLMHKQDKERE